MESLNDYLSKSFNRLSSNDISETNNFLNYTNFKKFIYDHYSITHIENCNYIKYVKVRRQILKLKEGHVYAKLVNNINSIILKMTVNNSFPSINFTKYTCKINVIFNIINERKKKFLNNIENIRSLFMLKNDNSDFKYKIMFGVNTMIQRYIFFTKYSKQLIYHVNKYVEFEESYGIDHKLIELNNMQRLYLGKKSEYTANKILNEYVKLYNNFHISLNFKRVSSQIRTLESYSNKGNVIQKYFYETNINILKLLNIKGILGTSLKGEVDGILIYYDGNDYIIEKIIEVKSSIKSTFEDVDKFIVLQKYIQDIDFNGKTFSYGKYIFTEKSFCNILSTHVSKWTTYVCINHCKQDLIEKSHLYFSNVLKIIDDKFIKSFYIDKKEDIILEKYKIICNSRNLIDRLFSIWKTNISLDHNCNVFITR